jgi:competence protein ComEA
MASHGQSCSLGEEPCMGYMGNLRKECYKKAEPAAAKQELLDINRASEADLKALAGIGDAYSKKIIAGRPYAKKDQLVSKKVLPQATYDKIKDKIVAKQAKK